MLKLRRQDTVKCHSQIRSQENRVTPLDAVSLSEELYRLFRVMWSGRWAIITPHALVLAIWRFVPRFACYQQQDAQEFFTYLVEELHVEMREASPLNTHLDTRPGLQHSIERLFRGALLSEIRCGKCKTVSGRRERFLCLSLDLGSVGAEARRATGASAAAAGEAGAPAGRSGKRARTAPARGGGGGGKAQAKADAKGRAPARSGSARQPGLSLDSCLRSLTAEEALAGENKYECSHCKRKQNSTKRVVVAELADALVIHVNRARWLLHGPKEKVQAHVRFPLRDFDMAPFCAEAALADGLETKYDLVACVCHHGKGMDTGHYSAICANPRGDWLRYNDDKVAVVPPEELEATQAYLLFYHRKHVPQPGPATPPLLPSM